MRMDADGAPPYAACTGVLTHGGMGGEGSSAPIKKSRLERMVNRQILAIFALLFTMATICTIGFVIWVRPAAQSQ
jgi:hypothetical protein